MLSACISEYLDDCYGLADSTAELYAWHLKRFIDGVGDQPVQSIDPGAVRSFLSSLCREDGKPYSPAFMDQTYRTLHTFFAWCTVQGFLPQNPVARVRKPRVPKRKSPRLSIGEIKHLLDAAGQTAFPERDTAMVCLMVDSGLRRGEVVGLRLADLDLDSSSVKVLGKGRKEREVPIGAATIQALRAYLIVRDGAGEIERVFLGKSGEPLTGDGLQQMVARLKDRTGLPGLRCHLLRHTFANHFIRAGGGLRKLQKILGHADVRTTASVYTDPEFGELADAHSECSPLGGLCL